MSAETSFVPVAVPPDYLVALSNKENRVSNLDSRARRLGLATVLAAGALVGLSPDHTEGLASDVPRVTVGMPFAGKWAYSDETSATCGQTYDRTSHPSCHETYFGDWSVDLYAASNTEVRLKTESNEPLRFTWDTTASTTCGQTRRVNIFAGRTKVGRVQFTHLTEAAPLGFEPVNGMVVGKIANLDCNPGGRGKHVHVELDNEAKGSFSCYINQSTNRFTAGISLAEGTALGVLGSQNTAAKQVCAVSNTSMNTLSTDTDNDTVADINDACPVVYGSRFLHGCPAEFTTGGDFNGDGYEDILAVSLYPDGRGAVLYLYRGSADGLDDPEFQQELTPANGGWDFSKSKMITADINGDAYKDLVIFHQGPNDEIVRHVFKGSQAGLTAGDPTMMATQFPYQGWKWSNIRIAGAGDFNGDGLDDVAVLSAYPNGRDSALYLFRGSVAGLVPEFQRELVSWSGGWDLRRMKYGTTDIDGDTFAELVIFHQGQNDEIVRHVFKGSTEGIGSPDPSMTSLQSPSQGWKWSNLRIVGAGDFNGDSQGDILALSAYPNGRDFALYNYQGSAVGLAPHHQIELTASSGGWDLTKTKGGVADITGDGKSDLVLFHQGEDDRSVRHILKGSVSGIQLSDPTFLGVQYPYQGWLWSRIFPA